MLFRIRFRYTVEKIYEEQVEKYIEEFKKIVDRNLWEKFDHAFFGTLEQVKANLVNTLLELALTRDSSDFISDNSFGLSISHTVAFRSYDEKDIEGYLLAMILKTDFSTVFNLKHFLIHQITLLK